MLYREIIAVCSQTRKKHINTLCGQNGELLNVKLAVHIVTTGLVGLTTVVHFLELRYPSTPSCNASHEICTLQCRYSAHVTDSNNITHYNIKYTCQTESSDLYSDHAEGWGNRGVVVWFSTGSVSSSVFANRQISSGIQTASYSLNYRGPFPGVKQPDREADHFPPPSA
jgi:hypothetical protein